MKYSKKEYRHLISKEKENKLISFRVPSDFPIDSADVKLLIAELDLVYGISPNLSKKVTRLVERVIKYYKSKYLKKGK